MGQLLIPGRDDVPMWVTVLVGVLAALVGTVLVSTVRETTGIDAVEMLVRAALAVAGVLLVDQVWRRRRAARGRVSGRGAARR